MSFESAPSLDGLEGYAFGDYFVDRAPRLFKGGAQLRSIPNWNYARVVALGFAPPLARAAGQGNQEELCERRACHVNIFECAWLAVICIN